MDKLELMENLSNVGKLIAELHHEKSIARRACITPKLQKQMKGMLNERKIDNFLYGSDLAEKIKETKAAEKLGEEMKQDILSTKKPAPMSRPTLNWRSPPVRRRSQQGGYKNQNQRARYPSRNRTQEKMMPRVQFQAHPYRQRNNQHNN